MVSFVDVICYVFEFFMTKLSNLMIPDNFVIDSARMFLFVFGLFFLENIAKFSRLLAHPANT